MVKSSKDKLFSLILAIDILLSFVLLLVLNQLNLLYGTGYIYLLTSASFAVVLVCIAFLNKKYASYFRKHSLIYRVISAIAFVFLLVAIVVRPTYYLGILIVGLIGFNMTLALLLVVIDDQNKLRNRTELAKK